MCCCCGNNKVQFSSVRPTYLHPFDRLADGKFPGLGLALVPDVMGRGGAWGGHEAKISFQISVPAGV